MSLQKPANVHDIAPDQVYRTLDLSSEHMSMGFYYPPRGRLAECSLD